ncbi:MAG: hypothetical protein KDJ53_06335 [Rhodobiaceae bacterium]|nr:hypothetical protein [Rhodobiaceae bacterium]
MIQTVCGPVAPQSLGRTLAHEHVVMMTEWLLRDFPQYSYPGGRDAVQEKVVATMRRLKAAGIDALVDCSALGHGRDIGLVADASASSGLHVVACTGIYTYDELPLAFKRQEPLRPGRVTDFMTEMFLTDIESGIQGTDIRAGAIKCASDAPGITANIDRIFRACAQAHRITGAPITTHTNVANRGGLDQQRIFREEGVDLSRVIIGHSGDSTDIDYLRALLDAGSFIGADRFGLHTPTLPGLEHRVATVAELVGLGYEDQILLSQDASIHTDWWPGPASEHGFPDSWHMFYVVDTVLPALGAAGVSAEAIHKMLVDNPARAFATGAAYS